MVVFNWLITSYTHFWADQVIHSQIHNGHGQSIGIGILVFLAKPRTIQVPTFMSHSPSINIRINLKQMSWDTCNCQNENNQHLQDL